MSRVFFSLKVSEREESDSNRLIQGLGEASTQGAQNAREPAVDSVLESMERISGTAKKRPLVEKAVPLGLLRPLFGTFLSFSAWLLSVNILIQKFSQRRQF